MESIVNHICYVCTVDHTDHSDHTAIPDAKLSCYTTHLTSCTRHTLLATRNVIQKVPPSVTISMEKPRKKLFFPSAGVVLNRSLAPHETPDDAAIEASIRATLVY